MEYKLLYYVAVPMAEEILNLITLFSIKTSVDVMNNIAAKTCGLFLYNGYLQQEHLCTATEWLLSPQDSAVVLAHYANKDYKAICEHLNSIANRPFNVEVGIYS